MAGKPATIRIGMLADLADELFQDVATDWLAGLVDVPAGDWMFARAGEWGVGLRDNNMKYDDRIRSKFGVTVCLREMGNGKSRLFFDDVIADKNENPITWAHDCFCTFTPELDDNDLDMMQLTDSQFQQIGEVVVARLLALNNRVKAAAEDELSENAQLTPEELSEIAKLSEQQIQDIDEALFSKVFPEWRKVAMVVALAMHSLPEWADGLPIVYFVQRLRTLVEEGALECQGDIAFMRTSEVRLRS